MINSGLGWIVDDRFYNGQSGRMATINGRGYYRGEDTPAICFIRNPPGGYWEPALLSTVESAVSYWADSGGPWDYTVNGTTVQYLGMTWYYFAGNHGFQNPSIQSEYPQYDMTSFQNDLAAEALWILEQALVAKPGFFLAQDGDGKTYTIQDGAPVEITGGLTAQTFRDYGADEIPNDALLGLTDPRVCYWQEEDSHFPTMTLRVSAVPLIPQPVSFTAITLAGAIRYINISGDVNTLWNVSFDGGTSWWKHTGSAWAQVSAAGDGCQKHRLEILTASDWAAKVNGTLKFRCWLVADSWVKQIRVEY